MAKNSDGHGLQRCIAKRKAAVELERSKTEITGVESRGRYSIKPFGLLRSPGTGSICGVAGRFAIFILLILAAFPRPAAAYLDPGTGSMILQALVAGIAGASLVLKIYWRRVKALFTGQASRRQASTSEDGSE